MSDDRAVAATERPMLYTMDAALGRTNEQAWNQGGPVAREPAERDPPWISAESDGEAKTFLGEWLGHVDAGRIGPNAKAKEPEVTEPAAPRLRTFGLNSAEAYEILCRRR